MPPTSFRPIPLLAGLILAVATPLTAQTGGLNLSFGRWWADSGAVTYSASFHRALLGPFDYGLGLTHIASLGIDGGRQTGGELSLGLGRDGHGPYVVVGTGLTLGHGGGSLDALWSAGGGYAVRPLKFLSVGFEALYRAEDQATRGFWRLRPDDRRGMALQGSIVLSFGARGTRSALPVVAAAPATPTTMDVASAAGRDGASEETVALRAAIAQTAIEAMGAPYKWGGTDSNGFDCSGLIRYAYGEHGLILPRVSRDQARAGMRIDLDAGALLPGDILGFSVERAGVTHVGLYVGDGAFIHSASGGVKLTSLTAQDPDSRWWQQRWVVARRIVN